MMYFDTFYVPEISKIYFENFTPIYKRLISRADISEIYSATDHPRW